MKSKLAYIYYGELGELYFIFIDKNNNIRSSQRPAASHPAQPEEFFRFPSSPSSPKAGVKRYLIAIYPEWGTIFSMGNLFAVLPKIPKILRIKYYIETESRLKIAGAQNSTQRPVCV